VNFVGYEKQPFYERYVRNFSCYKYSASIVSNKTRKYILFTEEQCVMYKYIIKHLTSHTAEKSVSLNLTTLYIFMY